MDSMGVSWGCGFAQRSCISPRNATSMGKHREKSTRIGLNWGYMMIYDDICIYTYKYIDR
jgi:hypothetical protein